MRLILIYLVWDSVHILEMSCTDCEDVQQMTFLMTFYLRKLITLILGGQIAEFESDSNRHQNHPDYWPLFWVATFVDDLL